MNSLSVHSHPLGKENPLGMSYEKCCLDISHSLYTYLEKIYSKDIPQFENKLDFCQQCLIVWFLAGSFGTCGGYLINSSLLKHAHIH